MARYQRKDHLHQRAKKEGLRSRAAYKLEEVQKQFHILEKGDRVADLGCWPGGWLEVAAQLVGSGGRVVGVDRAEVDPPIPLPQVVAMVGDLEDPDIADRMITAVECGDEGIGDRTPAAAPFDVVLSDAAPKLSGVRETDRANEERLLEAIESLLPRLLRPEGALVIKILDGPEAQQIDRRLRAAFGRAKTVKLRSTRKGSTERYLVARDFRPEG